MPNEMIIAIVIAAALIIAAIITHERDPEKKIHLQEHHPPQKGSYNPVKSFGGIFALNAD